MREKMCIRDSFNTGHNVIKIILQKNKPNSSILPHIGLVCYFDFLIKLSAKCVRDIFGRFHFSTFRGFHFCTFRGFYLSVLRRFHFSTLRRFYLRIFGRFYLRIFGRFHLRIFGRFHFRAFRRFHICLFRRRHVQIPCGCRDWSVSYTHLDVYKRQSLYRSDLLTLSSFVTP